jgi:predicted transcriptional regulator
MNTRQSQILSLFQALPHDEQHALLTHLIEKVEEAPELTQEQIAAIDEGLAQMRRGETITGDELFGRLAKKFGFERT